MSLTIKLPVETLLRGEDTRLQSNLHDKWQNEKQRTEDACSWFVNEPLFLDWYNSTNSELLLFYGNMGSGKTVTMSYVIDTIIKRNEHELPRALINYHYCKSDSTGDAIQIISNLTLQLLKTDSQKALKKSFFEWEKEARSLGTHSPTDSVRKLGKFYSDSVTALDRPIFIIIDGLDECDQDSRNQVLELLQGIVGGKSRVKILYSARPIPNILKKLADIPHIRHIPDNHRDLILVEHFVRHELEDRDPEVQELVIKGLSQMVQGSAIWVQMTVKYIQASGTYDLDHMKELLRRLPLPQELSTTYHELFVRSVQDQGDNRLIASLALEVLAVARRPLSIEELEWAIAIITRKDVAAVEELRRAVNPKRVITLVGPFIDQFDEKDRKTRQIRIVHQSLKEEVIQSDPMSWSSLEHRSAQAEETPSKRKGQLEGNLLRGCVRYLLLREMNTRPLLSENDQNVGILNSEMAFATLDDTAEDTGSGETFDPMDIGFGGLFTYASCYWTTHYAAAPLEALPPLEAVQELCEAKSQRLQNWLDQIARPDCNILPTFPVYLRDDHDPLTITAQYGSEEALRRILEGCDISPSSAETAAWQLIIFRKLPALEILFFDKNTGPMIQDLWLFREAMSHWTVSEDLERDLLFAFLVRLGRAIIDTIVAKQWGNELLCQAARMGCLPFVEMLFDEAANNEELKEELLRDSIRDPDARPREWATHQSVGEAVLYNHVDIVTFLLAQDGIDAHKRHRNKNGYSVLHLVPRCMNPKMLQLLLPHYLEDINRVENDETPLTRVLFSSIGDAKRNRCAEILLRAGADPTIPDNRPFASAVATNDFHMCRLMVQVGHADPLSVMTKGEHGCYHLKERMHDRNSESEMVRNLCSLAKLKPEDSA